MDLINKIVGFYEESGFIYVYNVEFIIYILGLFYKNERSVSI